MYLLTLPSWNKRWETRIWDIASYNKRVSYPGQVLHWYQSCFLMDHEPSLTFGLSEISVSREIKYTSAHLTHKASTLYTKRLQRRTRNIPQVPRNTLHPNLTTNRLILLTSMFPHFYKTSLTQNTSLSHRVSFPQTLEPRSTNLPC